MSAKRRIAHSFAQNYVSVFAALGDETRLSLVEKLCELSPQSISQLAQGSNISRQATTKHLLVLESVGIVRGVRRGRENLFEFKAKPIQDLKGYLDVVYTQWDKSLGGVA